MFLDEGRHLEAFGFDLKIDMQRDDLGAPLRLQLQCYFVDVAIRQIEEAKIAPKLS